MTAITERWSNITRNKPNAKGKGLPLHRLLRPHILLLHLHQQLLLGHLPCLHHPSRFVTVASRSELTANIVSYATTKRLFVASGTVTVAVYRSLRATV